MKGSFLFKKAFKISLLLFALVFAGPGAFIAAESYTVEKGDTLYGISRRYGVSIDSLCGWNGIDKTEVLRVGQVLAIPTNTPEPSREQVSEKKYEIYKIKKGDTLYRLAMDYGLRVDQLINYNALDASVVLQIGQEIRIPVSQSEIELASLPNLPAKDPRSYSEKKGDPSLQWPVKNPEVTYMAGKVGGVCLSAKKNENVTAIHGVSAYNRIGGYWCGGCSPLLKDLLRKEWGFGGFVVSDYSSNLFFGTYMSPVLAVYNGNDVLLNGIWEIEKMSQVPMMYTAYNRDPAGFGKALREAAKNTCTMKMHTKAFNDPGEYPDAGNPINWIVSPFEWKFEVPLVLSGVKYVLTNAVNLFCWLLYLILM